MLYITHNKTAKEIFRLSKSALTPDEVFIPTDEQGVIFYVDADKTLIEYNVFSYDFKTPTPISKTDLEAIPQNDLVPNTVYKLTDYPSVDLFVVVKTDKTVGYFKPPEGFNFQSTFKDTGKAAKPTLINRDTITLPPSTKSLEKLEFINNLEGVGGFKPDPKVKIMPLGDSITEGGNSRDSGSSATYGYRGPLWTKLKLAGYRANFVGSLSHGDDYKAIDNTFQTAHEGHWGKRIDEIAPNVTGYLDTYEPDIVLIHLGTNDIAQNQTPASTASEFGQLLDTIHTHSPLTHIVVTPIIQHVPIKQEITDYNNLIKTEIYNRTGDGWSVTMVTADANFDYDNDMVDEYHPNNTGYSKIADQFFTGIERVLPTAHFRLDEKDTAAYTDSITGTLTMTEVSGHKLQKTGKAVAFTGSDKFYVDDENFFRHDKDDEFSISFLMMSNHPTVDVNGTMQNNVILSHSTTDELYWWVGSTGSDGKIHTGFMDRKSGVTSALILDSNTVIFDGNEHRVTIVKTASKLTLFVDGVEEKSKTMSNTAELYPATGKIRIGGLDWKYRGEEFKYVGLLDDLRFYNSALTREHHEFLITNTADLAERDYEGKAKCTLTDGVTNWITEKKGEFLSFIDGVNGWERLNPPVEPATAPQEPVPTTSPRKPIVKVTPIRGGVNLDLDQGYDFDLGIITEDVSIDFLNKGSGDTIKDGYIYIEQDDNGGHNFNFAYPVIQRLDGYNPNTQANYLSVFKYIVSADTNFVALKWLGSYTRTNEEEEM